MTSNPRRRDWRISLPAAILMSLVPFALAAQPAGPPPPVTGPAAPAPQPGQPAPAQPTPAPGQPTPVPAQPAPEPAWLPCKVVELSVLDKVDATHTDLSVAVGSPVTVATLVITVRAGLVRPPNQPRDTAAYVDITDKNPAIAAFHGWLLAAEPGASVFEHPIYDVRVTGCKQSQQSEAGH